MSGAVVSQIASLIMGSLFLLGVLLIPLGLCFILIPQKIFQVGDKLNKWVSTEAFFQHLNKPRYQERFFYRHHRILGLFLMFFSLLSVHSMLIYENENNITTKFNLITDTAFGEWLLASLYYILVAGNVMAFFTGIIIFLRPSVLKKLEQRANQWIDTDRVLTTLDKTKDLPETFLPGNPRIFGIFIIIGAIIIIISTKYYFM